MTLQFEGLNFRRTVQRDSHDRKVSFLYNQCAAVQTIHIREYFNFIKSRSSNCYRLAQCCTIPF